MANKLILSKSLIDKFNSTNYSTSFWTNIGIATSTDLQKRICDKLNLLNHKLNVTHIEAANTGESSSNYGYILNQKGEKICYFFAIPPGTDSRSGFLAQHVYSGLKHITDKTIVSSCFEPYNLPVCIININEFTLTPSKIINIRGAISIGLNYSDIFNRDIPNEFVDLDEMNKELIAVNGSSNQYFTLDLINQIITFKTDTLTTNTNDRYFYSAKAYPALYLASRDGYKIDITKFKASGTTNNGTLRTFINYAEKLQNI